ncbi:MAG: sigma-70 family RNA polymerase sigma factor, partial [Pseudohongiella sp.]
FFNLRSAKKSLGWLNNDEAQAVADDLGVDATVVRQMEGRMSSYDMAFDATAEADDDEAYKSPAYYLQDDSSDMAVDIEENQWEEEQNNHLYLAMNELDERSRDIITSRWLSDQKATLHELAAKYNVSAERIRQLEKNAMNKVRGAMVA